MVKVKKILIIAIIIKLFLPIKVEAIDSIIRVAFEPNLPPYQYVENEQYKGVHIDILNNIADKNNFIIQYIPMNSSNECLEALSNGEVDIVLGAIKNHEFEEQSTDSISQSSIIMIASNEYASLIKSKKNMGTIKTVFENETIGYSYIQKMKNLRYIVVSNQLRAFDILTSGEANVLIGVKNSILYQLEKANLEEKYTIVNNYMVPIEYSIITKKGDKELQDLLNSELRRIRISGDYVKIHQKWINEEKYAIRKFLDTVAAIAAVFAAVLLSIFIFNFRLNLLLKKQVDEKTKELQKVNKDLQNQINETRNYNELKNCIVEHSPSGIIAFGTDYKITLFNGSACNLTKLKDFPIGQSVFDIPLINNILKNIADKLFKEDLKIINKEITLKTEENKSASYRYDMYQLYNFDNSIRGAIITIDDITKELKIKEQEFEKEKNKALNQIIAGIAHEIRNPLTSIKTYIQLIPTKMGNQSFQNQLVEFVPKEVDRVNNLIKSLIDYAKPVINNKHKVNVSEIIKSCTLLIKPTLENRNIELIVSIENDLTIFADKNQVNQALINIILNGLDSMMEKAKNGGMQNKLHMRINAWREKDNIFIQVIDEGIGMTDEEVKKSTEPFYTNKVNGTGLGLPLSKQYIEDNNGMLTIESKPLLFTKVTVRFRGYSNE
jgi:polar amino acid transport system substrate-binding protein